MRPLATNHIASPARNTPLHNEVCTIFIFKSLQKIIILQQYNSLRIIFLTRIWPLKTPAMKIIIFTPTKTECTISFLYVGTH